MRNRSLKKLFRIGYTLSSITALAGLSSCSVHLNNPHRATENNEQNLAYSLTPLTPIVSPEQTVLFQVKNGQGPYTFELYSGTGNLTPKSNGTQAIYRAPAAIGTAIIRVTDASGAALYSIVEISPSPIASPARKTLSVNGLFPFSIVGGTAPYQFSIISNNSNTSFGSINAQTGEFTAPASLPPGGKTLIHVTDAAGRTTEAEITIQDTLKFNKSSISLTTNESFQFSATGGVPLSGDSPYTYTLLGDGVMNSSTQTYTAPSSRGTAILQVEDSQKNKNFCLITINDALQINPKKLYLTKNTNFTEFKALGGNGSSGNLIYSVTGKGTINPTTGAYQTGSETGTATITVTDSVSGKSSSADVTITAEPSFTLNDLSLPTNASQSLVSKISGGTQPYTFSVKNSEGSFSGTDNSTYTAPSSPGTYKITVFDSQTPPKSIEGWIQVTSPLNLTALNTMTSAGSSPIILNASGGIGPYTQYKILSGPGELISVCDSNSLKSILPCDSLHSLAQYTPPTTLSSTEYVNTTIEVTDATGNKKTAIVTIFPELKITPNPKSLLTGESFQLDATGGLAPRTFSLVSGAGSINPTGLYSALASPGQATIEVKDRLGNTAHSIIHVAKGLGIRGIPASLPKNSMIPLIASGGTPDYRFTLPTPGFGSISYDTSKKLNFYQAPSHAGQTKVRVTDQNGLTTEAQITVYNQVRVSPEIKTITVNDTVEFTVLEGSAPYTYSLLSGNGTLNSNQFIPTEAGVVEIQVQDSSGEKAIATITVNPTLNLTTTLSTLSLNQEEWTYPKYLTNIRASGGIPPYAYSIVSGGGTMDQYTGNYSAPTTAPVGNSVVLRVTDSDQKTADAVISIHPLLNINPSLTSVKPGEIKTFLGTGGVDPLAYSALIGTMNLSEYTAPSITSGALEKITVTDSLGGSATAEVTIPKIILELKSPNTSDSIKKSNQENFSLNGTCSEQNQSIQATFQDGTHTVQKSTECLDSNWSLVTDLTSLNEGNITLAVEHSNIHHVAAPTVSFNIKKDTVAPALTIATPSDYAYVTAGFTISGSCEEIGRPVDIFLLGNLAARPLCQGPGAPLGTYTAFLTLEDSIESAALTVKQSDISLNEAEVNITVTKDTSPPILSITFPNSLSWVNHDDERTIEIRGECTEVGRDVTLKAQEQDLSLPLGISTTTAPCIAPGTWNSTHIGLETLRDGNIKITAEQTDLAGNLGTSQQLILKKDTTAPTLVRINPPGPQDYINSNKQHLFNISGTCNEAGTENVTLLLKNGSDFVAFAPLLDCTNGIFHHDFDFSGYDDGNLIFRAKLADSAGNIFAPATEVQFVKDTIAPALTITTPTSGAKVPTQFTVSGSCEEIGKEIAISAIGNATTTATCNGPGVPLGTYSKTYTISTADGDISLKVKSIDTALNESEASVMISKDGTPPIVKITSPKNNSWVNQNEQNIITFSGECSEIGINVTIDSTEISPATPPARVSTITAPCTAPGVWTSSSLGLATLRDGNVKVTTSQTDLAGNKTTSEQLTLKKDTTAPMLLTINSPTDYINNEKQSHYTISGTCDEQGTGNVTLLKKNGATFDALTPTFDCSGTIFSGNLDMSSYSQGKIILKAKISDSAGNVLTSAAEVEFNKDTSAPTLTIASLANNDVVQNSVTVSGSCEEINQPVQITATGGVSTSTNCNGPGAPLGNYSKTLNFAGITGNITITAQHSDLALNSTQTVVHVIKDSTPPVVKITSPANNSWVNQNQQSSISVSGECSEIGLNVTIDSIEISPATLPARTSSVTVPCTAPGVWTSSSLGLTTLRDGNVKVTATQTDLADNKTTSEQLTLKKDATPPTLITINAPTDYINNEKQSHYTITGTCNEQGTGNVTILKKNGATFDSLTPTFDCSGTIFSGNLDMSSYPQGKIILKAKISDSAGNVLTSGTEVEFNKDTNPPTAKSILINQGDSYTQFDQLSLNLTYAPTDLEAPYQMSITEMPCEVSSNWETYSSSKTFTLVLGKNTTATIYVKFRDRALNESACIQDTIIHDNIVPSRPTVFDDGIRGLLTATPLVTWNTSTDEGSGLDSYEIAIGSASGNSSKVADVLDWQTIALTGNSLGTKVKPITKGILIDGRTYYTSIRAKDRAGNTSYSQGDGWVARLCPENYLPVPPLAGYTTETFCIAKYEAKKNIDETVALSKANESPWTNISMPTAYFACQANDPTSPNYDLITNAEWQTVARNIESVNTNWHFGSESSPGWLNQGHTDSAPPYTLAADPTDTDFCYGKSIAPGDCPNSPFNRLHILSNNEIIWDLSGNVSEWVKNTVNTNVSFGPSFITPISELDNYMGYEDYLGTFLSSAKTFFGTSGDYTALGPDTIYGGLGFARIDILANQGGIVRGESLNPARGLGAGGIFSVDFSVEPGSSYEFVGFRCVYHP